METAKIKTAVCDDDIRFAGRIEGMLEECFGTRAVCDVYLSAEELLNAVKETKDRYQLYVLDIEMKEMTGMEAAAKIREEDQNALIIFMTSHAEKMPEAFDVNAFHYLVKPVDEDKAREVFLRAVKKLSGEKKFFTFQEGRQTHTLAYDKIRFFESRGRKMYVQTEETEYEYYGTLKEVLNSLDGESFARVHHAYAVNMQKIERLEREQIWLAGDVLVPVSKTYRKSFLETYQKLVTGKL